MKSIDYLKELTKFEHRGSATKNERQAAEYILQELKKMGYKVEKQTFKTTRDNLYMLPLQVGVLLFICGFFSQMYGGPLEIAAFLLSLFAIGLLLLEISGKPVETSIMPKFLSQNVFTSFDESRSKRIIVSAHYDTQRGSLMFHPKIVDKLSVIYNISYIGFGLIPIGILLNIFNLDVIASVILYIGLIIVFANIIFMAVCEVTGRYTQGANDNGTGTALTLALANYYINHKDKFPDDVDMVFLFTGSEETGERGMKNFIKKYRKKLTLDTKFIILDNLGTGKITYLEGEGMIFYKRAGKMLLDIAEEMVKGHDGKIQKMKNLLLPTDALPAIAAGFDAIAFLGKDENGRLGNYHWHTDTIENVDTELLSYEEEFFKEYLVKVAQRLN
ncbi:M28 family peptidase [Thermoanaerobacter wiegelii]|uniref:Aminopeptidase-like protein n=1 Tax=Thermoanaerobacter wiegelii Rt8.B1 TaxID=697303 RepID=G2MUS6_9THEO|nr:M28 family peptidase [Thermoanaerobacter wiegelii]AEM77827.1 aminopeptidase-like protein [Thermoanaerobacter wiegelii Rt8.B1]